MTTVLDPPAPARVSRPVLLGVLAVVAVVAAVAASARYTTEETRATSAARSRAEGEARRVAAQIDSTFRAAMPVVEGLVRELGARSLDGPAVRQRVAAAFEQHRHLAALGVAFEPASTGGERRLFAPFVHRTAGGAVPRQLEALYDYTDVRHTWYADAVLDGPNWSLMQLDDGSEAVAAFSMPFFAPGATPGRADPLGVVFAAVPLDVVATAVEELRLGASGYGFALARDGRYLSHPRRDLVTRRQSIFQTAWETGNTALNSLAIHAAKGERGSVESFEPLTGQFDSMFYEPIASTGWTVVTVFPRRDFELPPDTQRRLLFVAVFAWVVALTLVASTLARMTHWAASRILWTDSLVLATALIVGIWALWFVVDRYPVDPHPARTRVLDRASAEQFLHVNAERDREGNARSIVRVPTGIFIRSISFQSSTDVVVTGLVWQRYITGVHDGVARGFTLPEAEGVQGAQVTEVYRTSSGGEERIGWQFVARLRQEFSYSRYPFDRQDVWVRLRPLELRSDVVLVPDFEAYPVAAPAAAPGVAANVVVPGWEVLGAFFDYRLQSYSSNFGLPAFRAYDEIPELHFNVSLRRLFIGPFVSSIVPIFVTVAMLFLTLVISSTKGKSSMYGFSANDTLRNCAALFFVVSFQHVALRQSLQSPVLMYFEYFYFAVDLAILLICVNAIVFAAQLGYKAVDYRDNMIPKLLFWPIWTASTFAITYALLY